MDAYAMNVAMSAMATAGMNAVSSGVDTQSTFGTTGTDFSQLLSSLLGGGTDMTAMAGLNGLMGTDMLSGLGGDTLSMLGGLSYSNIQTSMMLEAFGAMMQAERPIVTDPELTELLQQMKNLTGDDLQADSKQLMDILNQMQRRLLEMASQNGTEMAAQQALALFAALGQQMTGTQLPQETLDALGSDGGQYLLTLMTQAQPQDLLALFNGGQVQLTQGDGQVRFELPQQPENVQAAQGAAPQTEGVDANSGAAAGDNVTEAGGSVSAASVQAGGTAEKPDFQQTVRSVIDRMAQDGGQKAEAKGETLDIDALQQRVDAGVYLQNTTMANGVQVAAAAQPPAAPVETQLYDALTAGVAEGREEVTVKLAPEELGEVTIRLTKNAEGGMSLNIIAKDPETQQLLASQVNTLQETLQPYKVDVENIMTERQYEMLSHQQSFDGQRRQTWSERGAAYYGDEPLGEVEGVGAAAAGIPTTVLDTYI